MTVRSRDLAVAFFAAALMTLALSFALTTERASAFIVQPPTDVTILHLEWDRAEVAPGVISEGVSSRFGQSTFTEVSAKASDFFKQASYGVFPGWTTSFGGTFKIAAPRLPSGAGGHAQPCDTRFFEDITARADAAAQAAGVALGSAVVYYFDEKLCAQMPDAGAEAAVFNVAKRAVMQVSRESGPTRHELVHAVGHIMRLQHADSLLCTSEGARVPFGDNCTVEPTGDPYDSMGEGTGTFSAGAIKALGWLKDEQHKEAVAPNDDTRRTFALGTITDGGLISSLSTRALRFTDGGTTFWLEFRGRTGIDATEAPFPAQGGIGVILHKEIKPPFGREPIFQLVDLSPATPRSDAGLKLPTQSWSNPLGRIKINFVNFTVGGAFVSIGPKPGAAPLPSPTPDPNPTPEPTIPNPSGPTALVLQVGWQGQEGGTRATDAFGPSTRFTEASQLASNWFDQVSAGRKSWSTTYGGEITIPAPRTEFLGAGQPSRCTAGTFNEIVEAADAAVRARGMNSNLFSTVVYVFNGTVCQAMPDRRGTAIVGNRGVVVEATGASFGTPLAGSRALIEAVGHHLLGSEHARAFRCVDEFGRGVVLGPSCQSAADPYDAMGAGGGSFSAPLLNRLGWLSAGNGTRESESRSPASQTGTIAPLTAGPGRVAPFDKRAIFLRDSDLGLWVEYRQPLGVDAPDRAGQDTEYGVLVHRVVSASDGSQSFQLLDMTPDTPIADAALRAGVTQTVGRWEIKVESADQNGAVVTTRVAHRVSPPAGGFPHPVPPPDPDPTRSMLILNVGWEAEEAASSMPLETELLDEAAYLVNGEVNEWFRHSAPSGRYPRDWEAYAGGSFTIDAPHRLPDVNGTPQPGAEDLTRCEKDEDGFVAHQIVDRAQAAAERAGLNPDRFGHVMVVMTSGICAFSGIELPARSPVHGEEGRETVIGELSRETVTHELGHHLGLNHANSLFCLNRALQQVPFSDNCDSKEYGDPVDVMGDSGTASYNPSYANALGWMKNQFNLLQAGDYSRTFQLMPYQNEEQPVEGFVRALRLDDGPNRFWMEWREPIGPDSGIRRSGLYIRREVTGKRGWPETQLLDMTPQTSIFDPVLPVGQTWVNPLGTMQIKLVSGGPTGAIVTISKANRTVSVPDLFGKTTGEASAALEAVGLRYGGSTASVDDCTGTLFGRVVSQNPIRNQVVAAGTEVTVQLGQKPKFQGFCQ